MKRIIVCIAAVGLMAVMSCGDNRSGNRQPSPRKIDSSNAGISNPQKDIDPDFSIGEDDKLQKGDIIVIPMSVSYSLPTKSWDLAYRINSKSGVAGTVKIDSTTASNIVNDHTIVAVRVYGQEVTLLRE